MSPAEKAPWENGLRPDRALEAIRVAGGLTFVAMLLAAALAWHWINMHFEATRAELAGKAEAFDVVRAMHEAMPRCAGDEVPVHDMPGESARRPELPTEAPLR
jgi:hypothetical protein